MQYSISQEILAAVIGISSGIIGYAFREYRNRVKPFFHITKINGTVTRRTDSIQISDEINDLTKDNFYVKELGQNSTLGDINDKSTKATRLKAVWPKIETKIEALINVDNEKDATSLLYGLFDYDLFEELMLRLLVTDKVNLGSCSAPLEEKISIFDDDDHDGSVWICFPEHAKNFGNNFKSPVIRAKCQPFIDTIKHLDLEKLKDCFSQVLNIMKKEFNNALLVEPKLIDVINENSRWVFYCYLANLSNRPIVVNHNAIIAIRDKQTGKFKEECYLAVIEKGSIQDTEVPLVVKPGEGNSFCFISRKIQKEMIYGTTIRETYDRSQATCRIGATISKTGLIGKQKSWSSKYQFKE